MIVKVMDAPAVYGGKAVMLCDDEGKPLPNQVRSNLVCDVDKPSIIVVTFQIDGERVKLVEG